MSKELIKEDVIQNKKQAIKSIDKLLESYINDPTGNYLKKASLLSKWLKQYVNYVRFEEKFEPKKNISYKRGDIVFVNFGFNIDAEFGGEHYAVVIDKENAHNSSTITVIPLSSFKQKNELHPNDLYLGNELYEKLQIKLKTLTSTLREEHTRISTLLKFIESKLSPEQTADDYSEIIALLSNLEKQQEHLHLEIIEAEKIKKELLTLKKGSVAKIRQIRTISKMRIYNPKHTSDPLFGIRYSEETMKLINEKLKEFLIFDE